ncbi:hypothetical protein ACFL0L_01605 [Patescibacteria group bacterium]
MNYQKGFTHWVVVILISVIAVGLVGAAWYYEENKEEVTTTTNTGTINVNTNIVPTNSAVNTNTAVNVNSSTNTNTVIDETDDWQVHRDDFRYGFTFKYPTDWEFSFTDQLDKSEILFRVSNSNGSKFDVLPLGDFDFELSEIITSETVIIDGQSAQKTVYKDSPNYEIYSIIDYELNEWTSSNRIELIPTNEADAEILQNILSTFEFLQDTSDWLTYTNDEYGYSISYPNDWTTTSTLASPGSIGIYAPSDSAHITIVPDYGINTLGFDALTQSTTQTILGGEAVTQVTWRDADGMLEHCSYQFEQSPNESWVPAVVTNEIHTTTETPPGNFINYECADEVTVPQILSTFQFTD